jgi:hypothetical protein
MVFRILILFLLFPISAHCQLNIDGYVLDRIKNTPLPHSRVTLYLYQRDTLIHIDKRIDSLFDPPLVYPAEEYVDSIYYKESRLFSDTDGYFIFKNLTPGVYKITAESSLKTNSRGSYYEEYDQVIYSAANCDSTITANIYLSVFCPYDSTKNLAYCPKCNKMDKIKIILWGLPPVLTPEEEDKYILTGDCSPPRCRPSKYCTRCKLEF